MTPTSGYWCVLSYRKTTFISDWLKWESGTSVLKFEKATHTFSTNKNSVVANSSTWSHMVVRRTKTVHFQSKKSVGFFGGYKQTKRKRKANAIEEQQRYTKLPLKWEISLVHYKRGYSGPGMLGEFVVVCLCDIWGLPQFSNVCYDLCKKCLYMSI